MAQSQKLPRLAEALPEGFQGTAEPRDYLAEAAKVDPAAKAFMDGLNIPEGHCPRTGQELTAQQRVERQESEASHARYLATMALLDERTAHEAAGGEFKEPEPGKEYTTLAEWVKATAMIPPVRKRPAIGAKEPSNVVPIHGGNAPFAGRG